MPNRSSSKRRRWITCGVAAAVVAVVAAGSVVAASAAAPTNTKEPFVTGSPIVGKDLTGDRGGWSGSGNTYAYKWLRCDKSGGNCTAISGATGTHHTVTSADLGTTLRFEVTASNSDGKNTATSNPTAEITNGTGVPANSSPPTITGTAAVDNTLTAGIGSWVGDQPITYSYQWQHCDKSGNSCGSISNATKSTYKITQKQFDRTIRLKVIAKNNRGNSNAISVQTAVVAASSGGGGSGIINLPNGGKSVDVVDIPASERLIVQTVDFNPNPVRSRTQPITITVTVKDTRGYYVRNAFVFVRSTPILTDTPTDAQTAVDGRVSYAVAPRSDFPLRTGYSVQFFVKAYRKGDPTLAGISGTRLVQVSTASN